MKVLRIAMLTGMTAVFVAAIWVLTQPESEERDEVANPLPSVKLVPDDEIRGICVIASTDNESSIRGMMRFRQKGLAVEVTGVIQGLAPGLYRFAVTEFGDVRNAGAGSMGEEFYRPNWTMPADGTALADALTFEADASGTARFQRLNPAISLYGAESIIGRACTLYDLSEAASAGSVAVGVIGRENQNWSPMSTNPVTAHEADPLDNC